MPSIDEKERELSYEIQPILSVASEIKVTNAQTFQAAGGLWKDLCSVEKRIKEYWDTDISAAYALHKSLTAKRESMLKPVGEMKISIRSDMRRWEDEQERARREIQAKAEAEARRMAEDEALAKAAALEKAGMKEEAAAVMERPVTPIPVFFEKAVPSGFGGATRRTWGAEVTDLMALVKAVATGTVPIHAIEGNMVFLNQQARALKRDLAYPGVMAVER